MLDSGENGEAFRYGGQARTVGGNGLAPDLRQEVAAFIDAVLEGGDRDPGSYAIDGVGYCPQCGSDVEEGASFCSACGAKVGDSASSTFGSAGAQLAASLPSASASAPPQKRPKLLGRLLSGGAKAGRGYEEPDFAGDFDERAAYSADAAGRADLADFDDAAVAGVGESGQESDRGVAREGDLRSWLNQVDEPFSTTLLKLIDERGLDDVDVYKRAQMSRQLFSRIRSDASYRPAKKTVLALAVALELSPDDARDLLERAGFALSRSSKRDIIVEYFLEHKTYDLFTINEALYEFDQPLL